MPQWPSVRIAGELRTLCWSAQAYRKLIDWRCDMTDTSRILIVTLAAASLQYEKWITLADEILPNEIWQVAEAVNQMLAIARRLEAQFLAQFQNENRAVN